MFVSFFPNPKPFFWSAVLWTVLAVFFWYAAGEQLGLALGILPAGGGAVDGAKVSVFVSPAFIWFYIYYRRWRSACSPASGSFYAPHPWWTMVDPRLGADHLRHLFPGPGRVWRSTTGTARSTT